jgi:hypothetical protein
MTPNSDPSSNYADMRDAALAVGRSWTDANGIGFTLKSADANGAVVEVKVGGSAPAPTCTRAAPTVSLAGPTAALSAGTTASFTLSVTNRDSSACAASAFSLARTLPSGWSGSLASANLTLSPGASGTTTLSVTSPATAASGSYGVGAGASSAAGSVHTASASATYSVAAAPIGALTQTVGTDKSSYLRGETVYISARVLSGGAPVAGASVKFTISLPGGTAVVVNATSASDGYARATYKSGKGKSAIGSYGLRADASHGGANATTAGVFSVR